MGKGKRPYVKNKNPMKKSLLTLATVLLLGLITSAIGQQNAAKADNSPLGTWQLVSTKYGDETNFTDYPAERRRIKMITATHFIWVDYATDTKKIGNSAGGPYTLKGNAYIETIEFATEGMEPYAGKKQEFEIRVDGDKLFQSGHLSDGLKIEENWRRLK
jgi:hypothetical protein